MSNNPGLIYIGICILLHGCITTAHAQPQSVDMPIKGSIISFADTLASCQMAIADDYKSCGVLPDCNRARVFCPTIIAKIEPAAGQAEAENIGLDVWIGGGREWVIIATDLGE